MAHYESKNATEFGKYIEQLVQETDRDFVVGLTAFGQTLLEFISKGRLYNTEEYLTAYPATIDLSALINKSDSKLFTNVKIIAVGRFILMAGSSMREPIKSILTNDFPKYLGDRSNFWRYLADLISKYFSEVNPDFTTQFLVANVCFIELIDQCFEMSQFQIVKHDKMFWTGIILHFFIERLQGEGRTVLLHLNAKTIEDIELAVEEPKPQKTKGKKKSNLVLPRKKK